MAALLSVGIGVVVALLMIAASVWWSFRTRPLGRRSRLPEALENRPEPDPDVIIGAGQDPP